MKLIDLKTNYLDKLPKNYPYHISLFDKRRSLNTIDIFKLTALTNSYDNRTRLYFIGYENKARDNTWEFVYLYENTPSEHSKLYLKMLIEEFRNELEIIKY